MVQFCYLDYRKILKIKFGLIFFKGPFWGAYLRRDIRFDIDWASLIVGRKFTVLALFYFVFEGNFPSTSPRGAYIWRGDLTEGFLRYQFGGLIFGGAYFRNFTVFQWLPQKWGKGNWIDGELFPVLLWKTSLECAVSFTFTPEQQVFLFTSGQGLSPNLIFS